MKRGSAEERIVVVITVNDFAASSTYMEMKTSYVMKEEVAPGFPCHSSKTGFQPR